MNIPFFGQYGTKFGTASATNPGVASPGNLGNFVGETAEDARASVTGINKTTVMLLTSLTLAD